MSQLDLGLEPPADEEVIWWTGCRPCYCGECQSPYTIMIRGAGDPERHPGPQFDKAPHLTVRKTPAEEWAVAIALHLADGIPRTFNRIGVEMLDKTADCLGGTHFEDGLWMLAEAELVDFTLCAPVLFRRGGPLAFSRPISHT